MNPPKSSLAYDWADANLGHAVEATVASTPHTSATRRPRKGDPMSRDRGCFDDIPKCTIAVTMNATFSAARKRFALPRSIYGIATAVALLASTRVARAQRVGFIPLVLLGGDAEERLRLGQLLGETTPGVFLLRSTSRLASASDTSTGWSVGFSLPEARTVRNSGLPFSLNDGPLWAGRGWSESVTAGLVARVGRARLIVAPTLVSSDNESFQVIPFSQDQSTPRNVWANPFHPLPESIDLPLRFGDRRLQRLDPGQSSLTIDAGRVSIGVATENLWWGPGIRNAITLSNNAPGFPHLFIQTKQPLRTRAGSFDAQWIVGQLSESDFFDSNPSNNKRSLAGVVATWTTPFDSALTLGVARLVMGARSTGDFPFAAAFDVLRTVGHTNVDAPAPVPADARDQIFSFFGRWLLPAAGFEAYVEWARFEEPVSLRDFLEYPGHSEGYTLGFQWAHPIAARATFRLQSEASYLEPDPSLRLRPVAVTYTSRGVPQGFTQQGQMLGAAIGPGASSQWLAGEVFSRGWRVGPYLGRIRWDNGTLEEPIVPLFKRQDVSLFAGVRAGGSWHDVDLLVDFAHGARFNYLFQAYVVGVAEQTKGIDLVNNTLSVTLSTALGRR